MVSNYYFCGIFSVYFFGFGVGLGRSPGVRYHAEFTFFLAVLGRSPGVRDNAVFVFFLAGLGRSPGVQDHAVFISAPCL